MRRPRRAHDSSAKPARIEVVSNALFDGALRLLQPTLGYRVNVDTLLLADFVAKSRPRAKRLVDLGAGVGALSLAVNHLARVERAELVEIDADLADLAERNLAAAALDGRVHRADLAAGLPALLAGSADTVVSNPPFFGGHASNRNTGSPARARARSGSVEPFLAAAARAMGRRASAFFVYPAAALTEFLGAAADARLVPKRIRWVHAYDRAPARVALVELKNGKPGGLVVEPPLFEWASEGVRSAELAALVTRKRRR